MKLSVIIPCFNGAKTIATQLEALDIQVWEEPWEVIVSDNGSTDRTCDVVEGFRDRLSHLRIVDASGKKGQAYALNVAVRAARSDAVAFCDADDEVAPGWVAAMGEALRDHDLVAGRFELKKLNPPWLALSHAQEHGLNTYRYPSFMPHAGSGNMGVRRSVFQSAGGFDESIPYLFDTDFCFRAQLAGTRIHFVPDAVLHYRAPADLGSIWRKAGMNGQYNVLLYKKYRPLGMPKLSLRSGLAAWGHTLGGVMGLRNKADLAQWAWGFAWRLGRVKGCLKYRTLAL